MSSGGGKTVVENDPYENMPDWMEDAYKNDAAFRESLLEGGADIADFLGDNPREVLGPSELEQMGLEMGLEGIDLSNYIAEIARQDLGGGREGYESGYTDDVVDTTLAGMDRNDQRAALARESKSAAIGGTTNSRRGVEEAVAGQLSGMNRAQMEANLRDEGFRFASDKGLEEAGLLDRMATSELSRRLTGAGVAGSYGEMERGLEQQQLDEERTAGQQATSWLSDLFSGSQYNKGPTGSTQTSEESGGSVFGQILGAGTSLAGAFMGSDINMKEDVEEYKGSKALEDVRALEPATYRYKDGFGHRTDKHAGLIAQSAEGIPGATRTGENGYKELSPYVVLATVVGAVKELDREMRSDKESRVGGAGLREIDRVAA